MPQLDVIGLIVADLARSIPFYEQLGLRFPENPDAEGHGQRYAQVKDPDGNIIDLFAPISGSE